MSQKSVSCMQPLYVFRVYRVTVPSSMSRDSAVFFFFFLNWEPSPFIARVCRESSPPRAYELFPRLKIYWKRGPEFSCMRSSKKGSARSSFRVERRVDRRRAASYARWQPESPALAWLGSRRDGWPLPELKSRPSTERRREWSEREAAAPSEAAIVDKMRRANFDFFSLFIRSNMFESKHDWVRLTRVVISFRLDRKFVCTLYVIV